MYIHLKKDINPESASEYKLCNCAFYYINISDLPCSDTCLIIGLNLYPVFTSPSFSFK